MIEIAGGIILAVIAIHVAFFLGIIILRSLGAFIEFAEENPIISGVVLLIGGAIIYSNFF